ncbi:MAG TPA: CARDB domain-containing protein, partial [Candidatus Methanoperedens sp.]
AISNLTVNPGQLSPKDTFDLTFSVSNEGTGIARDIQVSTATNNTPFVPVDADTKIIRKLDPGEGSLLGYRFQVKDKTEISSYSIPVKMGYRDENGTSIISQNFAGVKIVGKAELSISNIKIEPLNPAKGDTVTVTMRIENSGNGDAKSAKVDLNIPFEGTKIAFLGKIKPDDDAPAVFTFSATESGDIPYSATIGFEDDLGLHNTTETLHFFVRGPDNGGMIAMVIAGMLLIGVIVFYLLHRKRTR